MTVRMDAHPGTTSTPANLRTMVATPSANDSAETMKPGLRISRSGASEKEMIPSRQNRIILGSEYFVVPA